MKQVLLFVWFLCSLACLNANSAQCPCGRMGSHSQNLNNGISPPEELQMQLTSPGQYCWHVGIVRKNENRLLCSGALISPDTVLTLAQCVKSRQVDELTVIAGLHNWNNLNNDEENLQDVLGVKDINIHPNHTDFDHKTNFAVIKLSSAVDCTQSHICTVCLPDAGSPSIGSGMSCFSSSWNIRTLVNKPNRVLTERTLKTLSPSECTKEYKTSSLVPARFNVEKSQICGQEQVSGLKCQGDVGDSLVCNLNGRFSLVGINALGLNCFVPGLPNSYWATYPLVPWIQSFIPTTSHSNNLNNVQPTSNENKKPNLNTKRVNEREAASEGNASNDSVQSDNASENGQSQSISGNVLKQSQISPFGTQTQEIVVPETIPCDKNGCSIRIKTPFTFDNDIFSKN